MWINHKVEFQKMCECTHIPYIFRVWFLSFHCFLDDVVESNMEIESKSIAQITTTDLLCWSFQITRGMQYLTSRKVLHGDLAARNILLCDDNVIKICDFGLARSLYTNEIYHKKEEVLYS